MNAKSLTEFPTKNPNLFELGKEVIGNFEIKVNGETFLTEKVGISMGCSPVGCSKNVNFRSPEEALVTRFLGIGMELFLPPGTYPIGEDLVYGQYSIGRRGADGLIYVSSYDVVEGYIKLADWDLDNYRMKGSFAYIASVANLPQLITGKFDLKDPEAPPHGVT